jgi:hypothetical protein
MWFKIPIQFIALSAVLDRLGALPIYLCSKKGV